MMKMMPMQEARVDLCPMVVEAYGAVGTEAKESFSLLASRLATNSNRAKAEGPSCLIWQAEPQLS